MADSGAVLHHPYPRGLVTCPDCTDTYLNAEYLKLHDCPAKPKPVLEAVSDKPNRRTNAKQPRSRASQSDSG